MFFHSIMTLAAALTTFGLANAACSLKSSQEYLDSFKQKGPVTSALCTPQSDGHYQLSLFTMGACVPTLNGGSAMSGCAGGRVLVLLDWTCNPVAYYDLDTEDNNRCGTPYQLDYFPGRPIIIDYVWTDNGEYYGFTYNGEKKDSRNAPCAGCEGRKDKSGLGTITECKCGFYVGSGPIDNPTQCTLNSVFESGDIEDNTALCTTQAPGNFQLAMETADPPTFTLYDADCKELAFFRRETAGTDCPLPLKISHLGAGKDIMITELDGGKQEFAFDYGGRSYDTKDGWCSGCQSTGFSAADGMGETACKCGFYVG